MIRYTLVFVPALLAATTVAQVKPHERALIKGLTGAWGNGRIIYDIARDGKRMQQNWVRGDNLPQPFVITEFGERLELGTSPALRYKITAIFDNASFGWSQLNADPTKNLTANAVTVYDAVISFPSLTGTDPNQVHSWIKLTRPFVFKGPHFIVQKTWDPGSLTSGTRRMDYFSIKSTVRTRHLSAGKSCGGTLTAAYSGTTYSATITGAPANVAALIMFAAENVLLGGTIPLPLDLTGVGMSGCELGVEPLVFVVLQTDASGRAVLQAPFPYPTNDTAVWSIQALHWQVGRWASTNVVNSFIGSTGLAGNLRIDKRGLKGPDAFNSSGAVLLIRGR